MKLVHNADDDTANVEACYKELRALWNSLAKRHKQQNIVKAWILVVAESASNQKYPSLAIMEVVDGLVTMANKFAGEKRS